MNQAMIKWEEIIDEVRYYTVSMNSALFTDWMEIYEDPHNQKESTLIMALVYSWQRSFWAFNDVLKKCPKIYEFWKSIFNISIDCKLYRVIHIKKTRIEGNLTEEELNKVLEKHAEFVACSKSIEWMENKLWSPNDYYNCIFDVTGAGYLSIDKFNDMGEKEVIVYKPILKYLGLLENMIGDNSNE